MNRKILIFYIKLLIISLSAGVVIHRIKLFYEQSDAYSLFFHVSDHFLLLVIVFLLMAVNWFLEAVKWRVLVTDIQPMKIEESWRSVLTGLTVGLLTPRRLGEVGGRILYLGKKNRVTGMLSFGVGSMVQTAITLGMGLIAFGFSLAGIPSDLMKNTHLLVFLSALFFLLILWTIFNLPAVYRWLNHFSFFRKRQKLFRYLENQSRTKILCVFLLGLSRYVTFALQFFLLIRLFGNPLNSYSVFMGTGLMYLVMTFLPISSLLDLGVRGSVAAYVFGIFTSQTGDIVMASLAIWIINLGVPAMAGAMLLNPSRDELFGTALIKRRIQVALRRL